MRCIPSSFSSGTDGVWQVVLLDVLLERVGVYGYCWMKYLRWGLIGFDTGMVVVLKDGVFLCWLLVSFDLFIRPLINHGFFFSHVLLRLWQSWVFHKIILWWYFEYSTVVRLWVAVSFNYGTCLVLANENLEMQKERFCFVYKTRS